MAADLLPLEDQIPRLQEALHLYYAAGRRVDDVALRFGLTTTEAQAMVEVATQTIAEWLKVGRGADLLRVEMEAQLAVAANRLTQRAAEGNVSASRALADITAKRMDLVGSKLQADRERGGPTVVIVDSLTLEEKRELARIEAGEPPVVASEPPSAGEG